MIQGWKVGLGLDLDGSHINLSEVLKCQNENTNVHLIFKRKAKLRFSNFSLIF